jgi:anti-anti-sigma factor
MSGPTPSARENPAASVVRRDGESATVRVCGEIDQETAQALRSCLARCLLDGCTIITVDLAALEFIDSIGLRPLVWARQQLRNRSGQLIVQNAPSWTREIFVVGGLMPFHSLDGEL